MRITICRVWILLLMTDAAYGQSLAKEEPREFGSYVEIVSLDADKRRVHFRVVNQDELPIVGWSLKIKTLYDDGKHAEQDARSDFFLRDGLDKPPAIPRPITSVTGLFGRARRIPAQTTMFCVTTAEWMASSMCPSI